MSILRNYAASIAGATSGVSCTIGAIVNSGGVQIMSALGAFIIALFTAYQLYSTSKSNAIEKKALAAKAIAESKYKDAETRKIQLQNEQIQMHLDNLRKKSIERDLGAENEDS